LDQKIFYRIDRASKYIAVGKHVGDPQVLKGEVGKTFQEVNGSLGPGNKELEGVGLHVLATSYNTSSLIEKVPNSSVRTT